MQLNLYKTLDSENVINKKLTDLMTIDINLKSSVDIVNPEIVLNGDFRGFNYAHIPELNRFYFIDQIEQLNLKLVKLNLRCDVLETYKSEILNSPCNYKATAKDGDYTNIEASSDFNDVDTYKSDIILDDGNSIILTTVEVKK